MSNARLLGALLAAGLATSGCAPYLSPVSPYGPGFAQPLIPARAPVDIDPSAGARGRWDNVMLLQPNSVLSVLTMDGQRVGTLVHADGYGVRLLVDGVEAQIARDEVMRVDLVHLPGSDVAAVAKRTAGGAVLGAGAAALIAGVIGGSAWPPPGVLVRAGAAVGGTSAAGAAIADRQSRVVYIAEYQFAPMRRPATRPEETTSERDDTRLTASYAVAEWPRIMELEQSTPLIVVMISGVRHRGTLTGVDETEIRIDYRGAELRIPRRLVRRIDVP